MGIPVLEALAQHEQILAHPDQRQRAAAGEVQAPDQFLRTRLGGLMQHAEPGPARFVAIGRDRFLHRRMVGAEFRGDEFEKGEPLVFGQQGVAIENEPGQRHARSFTAARDQILAQFGEVSRARGAGKVAAAEADEVATAIADGLDEIAEKRDRRHDRQAPASPAGAPDGRPSLVPK